MPTDSPIIEVNNLVRKFGDRAVLNNISFNVHRGETVVIMGSSGCGKSTLLRHLIGSMKPTSGFVKLFDEEITTMKERELERVRLRFGMLFQSGALLASLTVGENVALPLLQHTIKSPDEIEEILIRQTPVTDDRQVGADTAGRPDVRSRNQMAARARRLGPGHEERSPLPWIAFDVGHGDSVGWGKGPAVGMAIGGPLLEVRRDGTEGFFFVADLHSASVDLLDLALRLRDGP